MLVVTPLCRRATEFPFQHAHDDIVLPSSIDERRFAFAPSTWNPQLR
jgi:hypothetical protein